MVTKVVGRRVMVKVKKEVGINIYTLLCLK